MMIDAEKRWMSLNQASNIFCLFTQRCDFNWYLPRSSTKISKSIAHRFTLNFKNTCMKRTKQVLAALLLTGLAVACNKSNEASQISLTPSTTQASIGQSVSVTLSANANVSNWTVTPASSANKTYGLTTSKVNYFTFSQAGTYTVSVRARKIAYDSTSQSLNAAWNKGGGSAGGCTQGVDTASVSIAVSGK